MAVFQRNGKWVLDYRPNGLKGKRIRQTLPKSISSEQEAREFAESILRVERGKPELLGGGRFVQDLFPIYLEWYIMHRSPGTYQNMKGCYENHLKSHLGPIIADSLGPENITFYKKMRLAEGGKNRTINKELSYFSGFLRWAAERGHIKQRQFRIEMLPYKRPIPIVLSFDEVMRLVAACAPWHRAILLCLYTLGLRMNEARTLTWEDIDVENRIVRVKQKGGGQKVLPLNRILHAALSVIRPEKASGYVFKSKRTGRPLNNMRKALENARKAAGITKHINPHLLRHSVATHLIGKNINQDVVRIYLGHKDIESTMFYTHVAAEHLRGAEAVIMDGWDMSTSKKQLNP